MLGYPVPLAMATQHPDSASRGFTVEEEVEEALRDLLPRSRGGLGLDEKMIDYEGKLTPYHQVSWVVEETLRHGLQPGEDFLLTPRIPSERLEDPERQIMVLWGVLVANKKSIVKAGSQAVKYIITPMCSSGYEVYVLQRRILKMQRLAEEELGVKTGYIEVIPLVEDMEALLHVDKILEGMKNVLLTHLGLHYSHYRVLLGKSDTALAYGHAASSIALVYALSRLYKWAEEENTRVHPIMGVGALPFRGHLSPWSVEVFVKQYSGYSTVTIQSGIRYDQGPRAVEKVVSTLLENLHEKPRILSSEEEKLLINIARLFTSEYLRFILRVVELIPHIAVFVPRRRARLSHGEYPRSIEMSLAFAAEKELLAMKPPKNLKLPRAISYAASLYTMGVPPSLIGLGRGLQRVERELGGEALELLLKVLPLLRHDMEYDIRFYVPEVAISYIRDEKAMQLLKDDVSIVRSFLGGNTAEPSEEYVETLKSAERAIKLGIKEAAEQAIARAGVMRGSLG
ncbi:MAG TPA: phosphoenolpyruvate carboxylase [Pyrodictium delaneyi]|uniref:Phosphoenolpyruvate carboxylase n=1 Tax=Pyrodictium delaneyi TaxID=1273541 RepID=A0A833E8P0_9CREN|nr:phosphoenolpyruvate carboxylase [Pyrodictium delaneyi]